MYESGRPNVIISYLSYVLNIVFNLANEIKQHVRYLAVYHRFRTIGDGVRLDDDIFINSPEEISIGQETYIGADCRLNAGDRIDIGAHCAIASGCSIISWNHRVVERGKDLDTSGKETAPIEIGDGVWIGYDVVVLPGVTVGEGAVVGSGSIVTNDIPPFHVAVGAPAEPVGERTTKGVTYFD